MEGEVLLINMPFSGAHRPQVALGLLKAALGGMGIPCDVAYLNLVLADYLGSKNYHWVSEEMTDMAFAGEWVFAHNFFGDVLLDRQGYLQYLRRSVGLDEATIGFIAELRRLIPQYLEHCLRIIDWSRYAIIGFTSTFEQNMASLSLAHAIKERHSEKVIVMGGANCDHPMGEAILRCFPFIDYVFTGESDYSFPTFVERLYRHQPVSDIKGLIYRDGSRTQSTGPPDMITNMDALPFPDYDDYFAQLGETSIGKDSPPVVYFETSRGCWWGAKQHCTFCGLNALSMAFRSKSKERALEEIEHLCSRYSVQRLAAVDNIIDMKYFHELLPELKRRRLDLSIFYETKANLTKEQVKLLNEAGVNIIQPGIESFSFKLLKMMRKGVSPLQNIQLLKWCKEFEVRPLWNLLYGIPGESAEDYLEMMPLLQSIMHLPPPTSKGSIRLDRYSPYFQSPESFGLTNARPAKVYRHIYPFSSSDLSDLAYHYEFSFAGGQNPNHYIGPILRQLKLWEEAAAGGADLRSHLSLDQKLIIDDSRPNAVQARTILEGWQRELYDYCDRVRSLKAIENWAGLNYPEVPGPDLHSYLRWLVESKFMVHDQDGFLSLAIPTATERAVSSRQTRA